MIQIDKDVPLPVSGKVISVLLDKLNIGESFAMPSSPTAKSAIHAQMRAFSPLKSFITRTLDKKIRVWRIK